MSNSVVEVYNIPAELLMEWFYESVMRSCGDGCSVICCTNFYETSEFFIKWWTKYQLAEFKSKGYKPDGFFHERDIYTHDQHGTVVNYHDNNENFMFCGKPMYLDHGEISFIVKEDCPSEDSGFVIRKI